MEKKGRFLAGLALASGLIVSTVVATRALVRVKADDTIQVTGSAKRRIRSDLIIWSATASARAPAMKDAYRELAGSVAKVTAYLEKKGVPKNEITVHSIATTPLHPRDQKGNELEDTISGYTMEQAVEVRSNDVDKILKISHEVTELIESGVTLVSAQPEFHYTKLADLKIAMLADAARDSRVRAEQMAQSTGSKIGKLRTAHMGVIQINPADSSETSGEGNNDTTSLEKDIISVVTSTFALD